MDEHYNARTGEFSGRERRSTDQEPGSIHLAVARMGQQIESLNGLFSDLKQDVKQDINLHMQRMDGVIDQWNMAQEGQRRELITLLEKVESSSQRQHDDNVRQHERLATLFENTLNRVVDTLTDRVADHEEQDKGKFSKINDRLDILEKAPLKAKAGRWDRVAIAAGMLGIAIVSAWATTAVNTAAQAAIKPAAGIVSPILPPHTGGSK